MERMEFTTKDKFGNEIVCEVIATYHDDDTNKDYIVYTDKTLDETKKLKVYYGLYEKVDNGIKLKEAKTPEEKSIGLQIIKEILNDLNKLNG